MFVVINSSVKKALEKENLIGYRFKKLLKKKIVDINWINWIGKNKPEYYPESGEPEGYFDEKTHCSELDDKIGELWVLEFISDGTLIDDNFFNHLNYDFCEPKNRYSKIVSENAKDWIVRNNFDKWISITRLK